jgi:hypothetical protein
MEGTEYWPKEAFNSQKITTINWIIEEKLVAPIECGMVPDAYRAEVETALEMSNDRKEVIQKWFDTVMEDHIRLACDICGMTVKCAFFDYKEKICRGTQMAKSVRDDPSDENIKRLCWVLWYSFNTAYKDIMDVDMTGYNEKLVMIEKNIKYLPTLNHRSANENALGCISRFMNRTINNFRNKVRENIWLNKNCNIGNVKSSIPTKNEYEGVLETVKQGPTVFWVGMKRSVTGDAMSVIGGKKKFLWTVVSS